MATTVLKYTGSISPAEISVTGGKQTVVAGNNYSFDSTVASELLSNNPAWWHFESGAEPTPPPVAAAVIPIKGLAVEPWNSKLIYTAGTFASEGELGYVALTASEGQKPSSSPGAWRAFGITELPSSVVSSSLNGPEAGKGLENLLGAGEKIKWLIPETFMAALGIKEGEDASAAFVAMTEYIRKEAAAGNFIHYRVILRGSYILNGNPVTNLGGNSIWPMGAHTDTATRVDIICGPGLTTLVTGRTTDTDSPEHGPPSIIGGPTDEQMGKTSNFSAWTVRVYGELVTVAPNNPKIAGQNWSRVNIFYDQLSDRTVSFESTEPTHPYAFGIYLPGGDNSGSVCGFEPESKGRYVGIVLPCAHTTFLKAVNNYCLIGYGLVGNDQFSGNDGHSMSAVTLLAQECAYAIAGWSPREQTIKNLAGEEHVMTAGLNSLPVGCPWVSVGALALDIEDGPAGHWYSPKYHVYDANGQIYGTGRYARVVGNVGPVSGALTVLGGANLQLSDATVYRPVTLGGEVNETAPLYRTAAGAGIVLRPESESTQGSWDFIDEGKEGYAQHIVVGQNCTDVALFGIGVDYSTTGGILISCKAGGFGLSVANNPGSTGIGLTVTGWSAKASPARFNMQAGGLPIVIQSLSGAGFADGEVVEGELSKLKSATAKFVSGDTGAKLEQLVSTKTVPATIQAGTTITFVNSTTVTLSKPALRATTALQFSVSGRLPTEKTVMVEVVTATAEQWWLTAKKAGDGFPGFVIRQGGQIDWGAGVTTNDVFLKRAAEGSLRVGSATVTPSLQVGTEGVKTYSGKGAPGTLTGQVKGDKYERSDGTAGTRLYYATSTTAWEAVAGV